MNELSSDMLSSTLLVLDMFGLKKIAIWIIAYLNMLPVTTVLTILGTLITIIWIIKEFNKKKELFDTNAVNQVISDQKDIIRQDQAENVL